MPVKLPIANESIIDGRTVREHVEGFIRSATMPHQRVVRDELMRLQQVERGCGDAVAVLTRLSDHFQVRDRSSAASVLLAVMEAFARVEAEREDLRTRLSAAQQITGGVP